MREIKFRGFDQLENKMYPISMIEFEYKKYDGDDAYYPFRTQAKMVNDYDVVFRDMPCHPLMQYTGRKDKNQVEIYDGDILATWEGEEIGWCIAGIVGWWDDEAKFILNDKDGYSSEDENWDEPSEWKNYEIIGNVYQNKELIK